MQPTKRPYSNNLMLCGAPAKKVPEPPVSNDGSDKPSLLKALEAVLAAGRRGLLGPAALAAVEAIPDLGLECCDGKVGQEAPSSIPFLEEKEEEIEGEKARKGRIAAGRRGLLGPAAVEAMPDLSLECCDGKVGQEAPSSIPFLEEKEEEMEEEKARKGRIRRERINKINKVVNGGDTGGAVTPPVTGTESGRGNREHIWICGDQVITVTLRRLQCIQNGRQLGFPASTTCVVWRGFPKMEWDDLLPRLHQLYYEVDFPSIIVIHVGENDLLVDSSHSLVTRMQNDLIILQKAFQDVVIIWSSLLPRSVRRPSEKSQVMESERKNVNAKMEEFCNDNDMYYLAHPLLSVVKKLLFIPEGSLTKPGADIFITDLKKVLNAFTYLNDD